jgi:opacity protein-like surface antigen
MKKITLLVLFLAATAITTAQQVYLESGMSSTSIEYENSQGTGLENLHATNHNFMAIGYKNQLFTKNLQLAIGANYAGYGAIGSDETFNNFMEWNVNYAGLNLGLDYTLFSIKKASFYLKGGMSVAIFTQGTQTLNSTVIDLKNNDDFDTTLISMQAGAGLQHPISDKLSFYVQYLYGKSMDTAKGDETLKFKSSNVSFGLLIDISKTVTKETVAKE